MARLKFHYDGWLALPVAFRQALRLETGNELEAELAGGTIVLRPAAEKTADKAGKAPDRPAAAATPTSRSRTKMPAIPKTTRTKPTLAIPPSALKARGRRMRRAGEDAKPAG